MNILPLLLLVLHSGLALAQTAPRPPAENGWTPLVQTHVVGFDEELLELPGTVQAAQRSELAFQVSGLMIERPVVAGQRVAAGELLAQLDPRDFENRLALEQARLDLAEAEFRRFSRLADSPASPVTRAEVDRKRAEFEIAQVRTEQARKNLQDTTLTAPFEGMVAALLVDNHEQIQVRQPVLQLEASDELEVVIDLPERVIHRFRDVGGDRPVGDVVFAVLPERRYPVRLVEVATRADPVTQTFRVTLAMDRPTDVNLLPGMTATVYTRPDIYTESVVRVPPSALLDAGSGRPSVWVVDPESYRIERRPVQLGETEAGLVTVLEGLQSGERIVSAGVDRLEEGKVIRPYRVRMLSE
jgi:membrane fusion protein, multidrug efflux system